MTAAPDLSPTNSPPKTAKTAAELADETLTARCEALNVPGYNVETDGVFTVVRRTSTPERSAAFPARIARYAPWSHRLRLPLMKSLDGS